MEQLILHLLGDYVTQSDWMAQHKTKNSFAAFVHATIYALPFLLIGSLTAVLIIWSTHWLIDRFRLARFVCYAKNLAGWPWLKWRDCAATGYPSDRPAWITVWLMIAADNTMHMAINYAALRWT